MWNRTKSFVSYSASHCSSNVGNNPSLLLLKPHLSPSFTFKHPNHVAQRSYHHWFARTGSKNPQDIEMAPGASSTTNNSGIREFYAPRITEPSTRYNQQPMPRVQHQGPQGSIKPHNLHGSRNRTKLDDGDQIEVGCLGEIKNYKAGDEFLLLWKWVDDFMDKRRAKKNSSKSHIAKQSTSQQFKTAPSSSREAGQAPRSAITPSQTAAKRETTERKDTREYMAQRHTPWGELCYLYRSWKDQQAKKKADQARQRRHEEIARSQAIVRRDDASRGRSINRREPTRTTPSLPDVANSQPDVAKKPVPVHQKKRGEVQKHTVKIAQLPPVHNSVHLQHTPSNNYRTKPSPTRGQKDRSNRETHFSDFVHQEPNSPQSQKPAPSQNRFSSVLDPAKAIRRAKEAEEAKGPKCYMCGSYDCTGGYRDNISKLWVCGPCQQKEQIGPVECSVCGQHSLNTGYASNGLWMCKACRSPTTPKELPPSPKSSHKAPSRPKASRPPIPYGFDEAKGEDMQHCECDTPCPPIETFDDGRSFCPDPRCHKRLTPFPVIQSTPISEYDSDHLYSDDSYEPPTTTATLPRPIGLGIAFQDPEDEEVDRPTPPLKDSKFYKDSPTLPAMDYSQSYLRKPGTKHPYAPSPPTPSTRKTSISFAPDLPLAQATPKTPLAQRRQQKHKQKQTFNPTTYPYPSPPTTPTSLHKPRPASSVYLTYDPPIRFPYPPPPIPQEFANRPSRSGSVDPGVLSRAALARTESVGPMAARWSRGSGSTEGERRVLNRRSSWYDFWKPVFEKTGERSP